MKIVEHGVFWVVVNDIVGVHVDANDMFEGFDQDYVRELDNAYARYSMSAKAGESFRRCHYSRDDDWLSLTDSDLTESKHWHKFPTRREFGRKIVANTQYRKLISTEQNVATRAINKTALDFQAKLTTLVKQFQTRELTLRSLRQLSAPLFQQVYTTAWELGRKASGIYLQQRVVAPRKEDEKDFRDAVREELMYWQSFLDELEKDPMWAIGKHFTIADRIEMYAKTVMSMYHIGRLAGMPETVLLSWYPTRKSSGRMCPGCAYMVQHSPFPRDMMPTVPRAGDTPCLMRCVHKVIVRYADASEVSKRAGQLPSKESMLQDLHRWMRPAVAKDRKRNKDYNPWLGTRLWGDLK